MDVLLIQLVFLLWKLVHLLAVSSGVKNFGDGLNIEVIFCFAVPTYSFKENKHSDLFFPSRFMKFFSYRKQKYLYTFIQQAFWM